MNIENSVKLAIEEFGIRAFERFNDAKGFIIESNDELDPSGWRILAGLRDIKIKPLHELFAHDVTVYGDNAYLIWEILSTRGNGNNFAWQPAISNKDFPCDMRRKTSAALPFDIERAKEGDVVEIKRLSKEWGIFKPRGYSINLDSSGNVEFYDASGCSTVSPKHLRMRYPKKK